MESLNEVTIKSVVTDARLVFSQKDGEYFTAEYISPSLRISTRVWGYTEYPLPIDLFESMANEWKGWPGEKSWYSIEEELGLICTFISGGHIMVTIRFARSNGPEPWSAEASLRLEPGQLDHIAHLLRKFFLA